MLVGISCPARIGQFAHCAPFRVRLVMRRRAYLLHAGGLRADAMGEVVQAGNVSTWRVACSVLRVLRSAARNSRGEGRAGHDDGSIAAEKPATEVLRDIDGSSIQSNRPLRFAAALD